MCYFCYLIKLNGKPRGHIVPSRGFRQGPHLPFPFLILCRRTLTSSLASHINWLTPKSSSLPTRPTDVTHFFADDNIIFCQATRGDCNHLEQVLDTYEHAFGQKINMDKTTLFFSHDTTPNIQEEIKQRFGAKVIKQHETYLGLPSLVDKSKKNTFSAQKERLDNKLSS